MMNVYYTHNYEIKAISPDINEEIAKECKCSPVSISLVEQFLTGKSNPSDYRVNIIIVDGVETISLKKNVITLNLVRTLDTYLTKIELPTEYYDTLIVINDTRNKTICLRLSEQFLKVIEENNDIESISQFLNKGISTVYITEKDNPYNLLLSVDYYPRGLLENGELCVTYNKKCEDTSAYTRRFIGGYAYEERN
jgi:hypothetical protein